MSYGALQEPGYEARLAELRTQEKDRAAQAQQHIAALLRGAKAQEATKEAESPIIERIASALERIAFAARAAGVEDRVDLLHGDESTVDLPPGPFDAAICEGAVARPAIGRCGSCGVPTTAPRGLVPSKSRRKRSGRNGAGMRRGRATASSFAVADL